MGLMLIAAAFAGCGGGDDGPGLPDIPIPAGAEALAEQCGIDIKCEAGGIAEGNASISGVGSIDAFFQSVLNFKGRADVVASGIDAEVSAIGASFGIEGDVAAGLQAQISANLEGGLKVVAEPAKCEVDVQASVGRSRLRRGRRRLVHVHGAVDHVRGRLRGNVYARRRCRVQRHLQRHLRGHLQPDECRRPVRRLLLGHVHGQLRGECLGHVLGHLQRQLHEDQPRRWLRGRGTRVVRSPRRSDGHVRRPLLG